MRWITIGCAFGFLGVALGAFGAHGLSERLEPKMLEIFKTGAYYQLVHAIVLVLLGALTLVSPELGSNRLTQAAGFAFSFGIVVFSGSLYALSISGIRVLGAITPLGGLAFLAGWAMLGVAAFRQN